MESLDRFRRNLQWFVLTLCLVGLIVSPAAAQSPGYDQEFTPEQIIGWIVGLVVGVVITSVWYWGGSRLFRYQPTFTNCLIAAIVVPVAIFFVQIMLGLVVGFLMCLNVYIGLLVLLGVLIYLLALYVKWVRNILEIESTGVAFLLLILPAILNGILNYAVTTA